MVTSNVINGLIDNSKNDGNISSTTKTIRVIQALM